MLQHDSSERVSGVIVTAQGAGDPVVKNDLINAVTAVFNIPSTSVEVFVKKVKELFSIKEAQGRKEREDRAAARKEQSKHRRGRNDWER